MYLKYNCILAKKIQVYFKYVCIFSHEGTKSILNTWQNTKYISYFCLFLRNFSKKWVHEVKITNFTWRKATSFSKTPKRIKKPQYWTAGLNIEVVWNKQCHLPRNNIGLAISICVVNCLVQTLNILKNDTDFHNIDFYILFCCVERCYFWPLIGML